MIRIVASATFIIIGTALLSGCATNKGGYTSGKQVTDRLKGMSKRDVALKIGAPQKTLSLGANSEVWTYRARDDVENLRGGNCTLTLLMENDRVVKANIVYADRSFISFPLGSCQQFLIGLD